MKLAHTADLHVAEQSHLQVLKMIVSASNAEKCDHLLIAGDLFESDEHVKIFSRAACDIINQFKGRTWLIPGNHDPAAATFCFVERGKVFKQPENVKLSEDIWLTAIPYVRNKGLFDLIVEKAVEKKGTKSIMLVHGTLHSRGWGVSQDLHFPVTIEDLNRFGCIYAAMGHYHLAFCEKSGGMIVVNPGSPRTTRASDFGRRKFVVYETETSRHKDLLLDVPYNELITIDVDFLMSVEDITKRCSERLRKAMSLSTFSKESATFVLRLNGTLAFDEGDFVECRTAIGEEAGRAGVRFLIDESCVRRIESGVLEDPSVKELLERMQSSPFEDKAGLEAFALRLLSEIYAGKL